MKAKGKYLASAFVAEEIILGFLIQITDGRANAWLSFSAVLSAALFHLLSCSGKKSYYFTLIAFWGTLAADFLLVICDPPQPLYAMIFFSVTQICYFLRIFFETDSRKVNAVHISVRLLALASVFAVTVSVLGENTDALSIISTLYFTNLFLNVVFSFFTKRRSYLFSLGLICFLLCDIFVGMGMIDAYLPVGEGGFIGFLTDPPINMAWLFYVPSQTLISLSLFKENIHSPFDS